MARIVLGPIVSEARNKQGNLVYSRNQHGDYIRTRVDPDETPTAARNYVWGIFGPLAAEWSATLTEAQRLAWAGFAAKHPFKNVHGQEHFICGYDAFFRVNLILKYQGYATKTTPPKDTKVTPPQTFSIDANITTSKMWLIWTPTPVPTDHDLIWFASAPQNPGRNYFGDLLRWTSGRWANEASPQDMYADYVAVHGVPALNKAIGHRIFFVNRTNGMISAALHTKSITY